jgi:hypothetical protein
MKKRLFAIMFAVTMFTVLNGATAWGQTSQTIKVDVPFTFTSNKKVYPAGSYLIESVDGNRAVWKLRSTRDHSAEFLLALSLAGTKSGNVRVKFRRYGDKQFLAGFKTQSYEISLPASRGEKMLRVAGAQNVPAQVIDLETVTGGSR